MVMVIDARTLTRARVVITVTVAEGVVFKLQSMVVDVGTSGMTPLHGLAQLIREPTHTADVADVTNLAGVVNGVDAAGIRDTRKQ